MRNFIKNIEKAKELKGEGNTFFSEGNHDEVRLFVRKAIDKYEEAISYCSPEEKDFVAVLYSNIAICFGKNVLFDL